MLGLGCIDEFAIDDYSPPATVIIAFTAAVLEFAGADVTPVVGVVTPPPDAVIFIQSDATVSTGPRVEFDAAEITIGRAEMSASAGASVGAIAPALTIEKASFSPIVGVMVPIAAEIELLSDIHPLAGISMPIAAVIQFLSDATASAGATVTLDAMTISFGSSIAPATGPYVKFPAPIFGLQPASLSAVVGVVVDFVTETTIVTPPTLDEAAIDAPFGTRPVRLPLSMSLAAAMKVSAGASVPFDAPSIDLEPHTPAVSARLKWPTMQFTFY